MLKIKLTRKDSTLIYSNNIDYVIVNWIMSNKDVYLEHYKYYRETNTIKFSAYVGPELWCFSLKVPTEKSGVFFLESENSDPSDEQIEAVNHLNIKALEYDYNEFINTFDLNHTNCFEIRTSILSKFLNEVNDKCCTYDVTVSESESDTSFDESLYENPEVPIKINKKVSEMLYNYNDNDNNNNNENHAEINNDDVLINHYIDKNGIMTNPIPHKFDRERYDKYSVNSIEIESKDDQPPQYEQNFYKSDLDINIDTDTDQEVEDIWADEDQLNKLRNVIFN